MVDGGPNIRQWVLGELVEPTDFNVENGVLLAFAGAFAGIILGADSVNGNLACEAVAGTLNVNIGTTPQIFVLYGRIVNAVPSTTLTVQPNSTGTARTDMIVAQFVQNQVDGFQRNVQQPDGTVQEETVYGLSQACTFQIIQQGGSIPSGSYQVGEVVVPPNSANLGAGAATITLPTLESIIAAMSVKSLNGLIGALSLVCPDGSISVTQTGDIIQIAAAAAAASVTSLQGLQGAVTLACPDNSITFSIQGNTIELTAHVASAVTSVNTLGGAVQIVGDGAYIQVAENNGEIEISYIGDPVPVGATRYRFVRLTNFDTVSVTLPTLTTGKWLIRAQAVSTVTNPNMSLSLSGCASAEAAIKNGNASSSSPEIAMITGTANSGQAPVATLTWTGVNSASFNNGQLLEIWAYRDS
jgi:hypothetical protein